MECTDLKIKVCGMRDPENIKAVDALHPDYMGFIFYPPSPRYIAPGTLLPDTKAHRVGVFVNASMEEIIKTTREHGIPTVQLHGNESPDFCQELTNMGYEVFKAFRVDENTQTIEIEPYALACAYLLYDTKAQAAGGTGQKFDWSVLNHLDPLGPFILSGGIGPDDAEIIHNLNLKNIKGIDLNSRFELEPALKNVDLLFNFIQKFKKQNLQFNI
jgi:phosphoribosylanthranilate isomerase